MIDTAHPHGHNRLAAESSPYLLQQATQPVDWYPWGPEAWAAARNLERPILLSIGHIASHGCQAMARESFADPGTAALMNALFVNVKVDREEHPDLDRTCQLAHTLLTHRRGGWPLTLFLTHDQQLPFFGGMYFPPEARHGLPAFRTLLERVAAYHRERQPELRAQLEALPGAFAQLDAGDAGDVQVLDAAPLAAARRALEAVFDRQYGGFGTAPKFPQPAAIQRLLHDWQASAAGSAPDLQALYMASFSLLRMIEGGLHDPLGGGFFRCCLDAAWQVPHSGKLLGDNAALLEICAEAAQATGDAAYAAAAADTAGFLLRELAHAEGGFCAALDAGGQEQAFHLWTRAALSAALTPADAALCAARFGLDGPPRCGDRWHLVVARSIDALAADPAFGPTDPALLAARLAAATRRLLQARQQRPAPARDERIFTGANARAIRGLAAAARVLAREDLAAAAASALGFLRRQLWRDGRLFAVWAAGRARHAANLDDHVLLIDAILALQSLRRRDEELAWARELADTLLARFVDEPRGGFFSTADDQHLPVGRSRCFSDDAGPAGNAVAVRVLLQLGETLGEAPGAARYRQAAERTLRAGWTQLAAQPLAHLGLLAALEEVLRAADAGSAHQP